MLEDCHVPCHQASQILQNAAQCLLAQGKAAEARGLCERLLAPNVSFRKVVDGASF